MDASANNIVTLRTRMYEVSQADWLRTCGVLGSCPDSVVG